MKYLALVLFLISTPLTVDAVAPSNAVDFSRDVLPILSNKCFVCHGPDSKDPDLIRLDSEVTATADRGGYRAIDQARPKKSVMLSRLHSADEPMPPADAQKQLTAAERTVLTRWLNEGGVYAKHWAFEIPVQAVPNSNRRANRDEMIDAFIEDGFKSARVDFAPEADRATLARRVSLVLTGLPPEIDVLDTYIRDSSPAAYSRLVESLLANPRYGEHQARYWLDAVRYGDTHGLHLDNKRGIYPYRDWVVGALNDNLPMDQFIRWQLAGDLLADPTLAQRVATGFVRLNPSTAEGGAIPAEFQAKNNFDRTETLGTVLLGMTLTCSRCHTHKYDPVTQTEYYQLLAFFNSTSESAMDGNSYTYAPVLKAPQDQNAWQVWNQLEKEQVEMVTRAAKLIGTEVILPETLAKQWEIGSRDSKLKILSAETGPFAERDIHQQAVHLHDRMEEAKKTFTTTLVAKDLPKPRETRVLQRGEYDRPQGDPVQPDVLSAMGQMTADTPRNRLGLAQWLTAAEQPVVTRVLVNRIWARVFGDPLVRTPEDFGLQGQQPTHPELLDWLAVDFQKSGWDLKETLRLMVHSRTFKQASAWRKAVDDPANRLFARGPSYRLDAEVLRDIGLWASGLLNPHMGGEGVKPYQPDGMWKALAHPGSNTKQYVRDQGELLYRRSLYVYWKRTSPHPMMTLFDAPDRESSCVQRQRTNTALQSLGLLNETQRIEMGRILAERLLLEADSDQARVNLLFKLLASRQATAVEQQAIAELVDNLRTHYGGSEGDARALLAIGDAEQNEDLNLTDHAVWTQIAVTILASDPAILLY
ncbi:MAG: PSD1 and planctomycete cytochrome C domain-containing protein [Planctomycetota bacterium]|nr:PSD1 and planctomycete cytochrome C domain-containing protein [Planctomycetota bacterium]